MIGITLTTIGTYLYIVTHNIARTINDEVAPTMIILLVIGSILIVTAALGVVGVFRKQSIIIAVVSVSSRSFRECRSRTHRIERCYNPSLYTLGSTSHSPYRRCSP